ncbi:hypothetical protein [Priestia megaterium]|uniref:hypothetical protein n=1 Tax=Priestia megaterium TaxID=1404 RepID=UPI0030094A78
MFLYEHLEKEKSIDQIKEIVQEKKPDWSQEQIELYLRLDPKVILNTNQKWQYKRDERQNIVLQSIGNARGKRPIVKVEEVIDHLPAGFLIAKGDIVEIAISSGQYTSPRENVLRVRMN